MKPRIQNAPYAASRPGVRAARDRSTPLDAPDPAPGVFARGNGLCRSAVAGADLGRSEFRREERTGDPCTVHLDPVEDADRERADLDQLDAIVADPLACQ